MHKLILWINRILFPKRCGFCLCSIPEETPLHICDACLEKLPTVSGSGKQILKGHVAFVLSPFCYARGVRTIIKNMKFANKPMLAETLAAFMAERLVKVCDTDEFDVVIPVPMTHKKQAKRGYNPAALLAKAVARRCDLPYDESVLVKIKETKPQSTIRSYDKRVLNIRDAFACKRDLEDASVLLVDDVFTTGQTVQNCAKALKVAGVRRICVLTAAQAHARPSKAKVRYQRLENLVFRMDKQ